MQVLIVTKKTKFELDMEKYAGDLEFYKKLTAIQNNSFERIYSSHLRQLESRKILKEDIFPKGTFIFRDSLENLQVSQFDLIVALGGDNHFTYVAHYCQEVPILGCNSDEKTSFGALLSFTPETLKSTVKENWKSTQTENWSMIQGELEYIDGKTIQTIPCVSEISLRNNNPDLTSRYVLHYDGITEEQKSSGLLLYTGAGYTGWYMSCAGLKSINPKNFPKDAPFFKVYSRELSYKARKNLKLHDFAVHSELKVISEMDGGISVDALPERIYSFPVAATAKFFLSKQKLKVITRKDKEYKSKIPFFH